MALLKTHDVKCVMSDLTAQSWCTLPFSLKMIHCNAGKNNQSDQETVIWLIPL